MFSLLRSLLSPFLALNRVGTKNEINEAEEAEREKSLDNGAGAFVSEYWWQTASQRDTGLVADQPLQMLNHTDHLDGIYCCAGRYDFQML